MLAAEDNWFRKEYYKASFYKSLLNKYNEETEKQELTNVTKEFCDYLAIVL